MSSSGNRLPESGMRHFFLEVHGGLDIIEFIISFARRWAHTVVTVLSASGMVTNVNLRHGGLYSPVSEPHRLVSLSGCFIDLPHVGYSGSLSAVLAFTSGDLISGMVSGSIMASGPVVVVLAASGGSPPFIRPPLLGAAVRPPVQ